MGRNVENHNARHKSCSKDFREAACNKVSCVWYLNLLEEAYIYSYDLWELQNEALKV